MWLPPNLEDAYKTAAWAAALGGIFGLCLLTFGLWILFNCPATLTSSP